jgi:S1-C subfamily serine protease
VGGFVGGAAGGAGGRGGRAGGGRGGAATTAPADDNPARVASAPGGTPLYQAGLDAGDLITAADGKEIKTGGDFSAMVASHKPGDKVSVTFTDQAGDHTTSLTIAENPALQTVSFEDAGRTPSADQLAFRNKWVEPKSKM